MAESEAELIAPETSAEQQHEVHGTRKEASTKLPTKQERNAALFARIRQVVNMLMPEFEAELKPPPKVQLVSKAIEDPKTGGWIGHVRESLANYIQRVNVQGNFSQRPPYDHLADSIYRRLIHDFISGALMPESRVAALVRSEDGRAPALDVPGVYFSVIDGLQRLWCYRIALLLVWQREELVRDKVVAAETWNFFKDAVEGTGDPKAATIALLGRPMHYELFYRIDRQGLLHYMVTYNTGQRRMSLPVLMEVMYRPLIEELKGKGIIIYEEQDPVPGATRPRPRAHYFKAADLALAFRAFVTQDPNVTATSDTQNVLNEAQPDYLTPNDIGEPGDAIATLTRLCTEFHTLVQRLYVTDHTKGTILSDSAPFLIALCAACGSVLTESNKTILTGSLDKLRDLMTTTGDRNDPLGLSEYRAALESIRGRRRKLPRLVYLTFERFFKTPTAKLEWLYTADFIR